MEVNISEAYIVKEIKWNKFKIFEGKDKDRLIIEGPEYRLIISEGRVYMRYTHHRPDHDHNNQPEIYLDIPKNGSRKGENAKLTIGSDSGYYPDLFLDWGYGKKVELEPGDWVT